MSLGPTYIVPDQDRRFLEFPFLISAPDIPFAHDGAGEEDVAAVARGEGKGAKDESANKNAMAWLPQYL